MNENFISGEYDVTKKTKLRKFYDDYKILIFFKRDKSNRFTLIILFFINDQKLFFDFDILEYKNI